MADEDHIAPSFGEMDRLRGLGALQPLFEGPNADAGMAVEALLEAAYRLGWVMADFDWPTWSRGPECQRLVLNSDEIGSADALTLAKLLTAHLRQDRFCEGHLVSAFDSGHLLAIVRRAWALAQDHPRG